MQYYYRKPRSQKKLRVLNCPIKLSSLVQCFLLICLLYFFCSGLASKKERRGRPRRGGVGGAPRPEGEDASPAADGRRPLLVRGRAEGDQQQERGGLQEGGRRQGGDAGRGLWRLLWRRRRLRTLRGSGGEEEMVRDLQGRGMLLLTTVP